MCIAKGEYPHNSNMETDSETAQGCRLSGRSRILLQSSPNQVHFSHLWRAAPSRSLIQWIPTKLVTSLSFFNTHLQSQLSLSLTLEEIVPYTMLNKIGKDGHPCLSPGLRGEAFSFSPSGNIITMGLWWMIFTNPFSQWVYAGQPCLSDRESSSPRRM